MDRVKLTDKEANYTREQRMLFLPRAKVRETGLPESLEGLQGTLAVDTMVRAMKKTPPEGFRGLYGVGFEKLLRVAGEEPTKVAYFLSKTHEEAEAEIARRAALGYEVVVKTWEQDRYGNDKDIVQDG